MAGQEPRSKKLKRLVNVQRQLERMAEGELAANTEQRREVEQSMEVVMEAISSASRCICSSPAIIRNAMVA